MTTIGREKFLREFSASLADDNGVLFIGAGVSKAAGYPSWAELLKEIGDELGVSSNDVGDLAALAQWSIHASGSKTRIRKIIRDAIGALHPLPEAVRVIARLPTRHIWTTNYDRLIERALDEVRRPVDVVAGPADLSIKPRPAAVRLYKMHGSIERLDDLVISTDDYELYRSKRGAYLPLLQAHLTSMSMLFVGISFADPNVKHVLSLIRESFSDAPPEHFAIVKPPQQKDFATKEQYQAKATQHELWAKDLRRYGLLAVEIQNYEEVPDLLRQLERRVAMRRVWISGSWSSDTWNTDTTKVHSVAQELGRGVGKLGLSLVTGIGTLVGSASVGGFLEEFRNSGGWDLERRLVARPFPQPAEGAMPDNEMYSALRDELARSAGIVIFVGGLKLAKSELVVADGVLDELDCAIKHGAFLLPVGATGGAAAVVSDRLSGSNLGASGPKALRPTDDELRSLSDANADVATLVRTALGIVERVTKASSSAS